MLQSVIVGFLTPQTCCVGEPVSDKAPRFFHSAYETTLCNVSLAHVHELHLCVKMNLCVRLTDDPDGGRGVDTPALVAGRAGVKPGVLLSHPLDAQNAVRVLQLDPCEEARGD